MINKSLNKWLDYLNNISNETIDLGLNRVKSVAVKLDLLHFNARIITVAGTNGKGSTISALEYIYHAAGYNVGSFTSPHLIKFNERIRLNLSPINDGDLIRAFEYVEVNRSNIKLTYFEMAFLAALYYFKNQQLDIILLEVGLGGRLDATNIVDADLSIITSIDFDHQNLLGNTLEAIGFEKAHIMRAKRPAIYGDLNPVLSIINYAESIDADLSKYGEDYFYTLQDDNLIIKFKDFKTLVLPKPRLNLKACSAAIFAALKLGLPISEHALKCAMRKMTIIGRLMHVYKKCLNIFDVSHNRQAVLNLKDHILTLNITGKVYAVFGAYKDKDPKLLVNILGQLVDYWFPCILNSPRSATDEELQEIFAQKLIYKTALSAYNAVLDLVGPNDLILVFGSFQTVGGILAAIMEKNFETFNETI